MLYYLFCQEFRTGWRFRAGAQCSGHAYNATIRLLSSAEIWHIIEINHVELVKLLTLVKKLEIAFWAVFIGYLCLLLRLAVFRNDFLKWPLFLYGSINAMPFYEYFRLLLNQRYLYVVYLFIGNIVSFIPFGFLLPIVAGRPKKLPVMMLCGFGLSLAVEVCQYVFGTGVSELDDLVLNTLGTAVGFLLLKAYIRRLFGIGRRRRRRFGE